MLEAGRRREKGREKEREARGFVRKGMMYDLSVPRSAVARFSTPSSSRKCAVASHSYELMVTLLVKMASNVSSLPSPNLYPPSDSIHLRTHSYRIESVDRTAAILPLHLRPQDDLVSLTDFRIESIPRSLNKYDEEEGREVIDKTRF